MLSNVSFTELDWLCINTLRTLSIDQVQKANSGHPGAPLGLAPFIHVLASRIMRHYPGWPGRDRLVLSNGHACALQYSLLHLYGQLTMDDLHQFRQVDSRYLKSRVFFYRTPGHPESHKTPGIEVTTGPLGQGFANAVGLAMAEANLRGLYGKDFSEFGNHTFVILGDGCMMEGITSEAASLAGHLCLNKLIAIYDDNKISIDGSTNLAFTEDVAKRFEAYGFRVLKIPNGNEDLDGMLKALEEARSSTDKPTLIILSTTIGKYSKLEGTGKVHGNPLDAEDAAQIKKKLGFNPDISFCVDDTVYKVYADIIAKGKKLNEQWLDSLNNSSSNLVVEFKQRLEGKIPENWKTFLPTFEKKEPMATRKCSQVVLDAIAPNLSCIIGGSADLTPSTLTFWNGASDFTFTNPSGRYIRFGVREHSMFGICNGLVAWHPGTIRPFASTFLNFITYGWGAVRLAALSQFPVMYIMTHDSIGLGEDGPTHQPIEVLSLIRATPNISLWRPADGNEVLAAYEVALLAKEHPTVISLSRQTLPQLQFTDTNKALMGAYTVFTMNDPNLILVATGSEVSIAIDAAQILSTNFGTCVVSMPSWDRFENQTTEYKNSIFSPGIPVVSIEAAHDLGWSRYAHFHISMNTFGTSGPYKMVYAKYGFTAKGIAEKVVTFVSKLTLPASQLPIHYA